VLVTWLYGDGCERDWRKGTYFHGCLFGRTDDRDDNYEQAIWDITSVPKSRTHLSRIDCHPLR
jgi:hypothetical protein